MSHKMFEKINMDDVVKASQNGYKYVTTTPPHPFGEKRGDRKKRYIYLHRAILEKKLGRYLKHDEQADHKDGNKNNNSSDNIVLKVLGEHQQEHSLGTNGHKRNKYWEKSPRTKPRKHKKKKTASVLNVVLKYLQTTG